jgi:hypothetical protein
MLVLLNTYPDIMSQTHILRDKTELPNGERKEATDTMAGDTSISAAPLNTADNPKSVDDAVRVVRDWLNPKRPADPNQMTMLERW